MAGRTVATQTEISGPVISVREGQSVEELQAQLAELQWGLQPVKAKKLRQRVKNTFIQVDDDCSDDDLLAHTCPSRSLPLQSPQAPHTGEGPDGTPRMGMKVEEESDFLSCSSGASTRDPTETEGTDAGSFPSPDVPPTPEAFNLSKHFVFEASSKRSPSPEPWPEALVQAPPLESLCPELAGDAPAVRMVKNTFIHVTEAEYGTSELAVSCPSGAFPSLPKLGESLLSAPSPDAAPALTKRKRNRPGVRRRRARPLIHHEDGTVSVGVKYLQKPAPVPVREAPAFDLCARHRPPLQMLPQMQQMQQMQQMPPQIPLQYVYY